MTKMQMLGPGLLGVGTVLLFLADDSGYFGAIVEIEDGEDGATLKIAMKTQLGESLDSQSPINLLELPEPPDPSN